MISLCRRSLATLLTLALLTSESVLADCPAWGFCQLENKAHDVGNTIKDVGTGAVSGAKKAGEGVLDVAKGVGQTITGHPEQGWKTIQDGGKTIVNGVIQVAITGAVIAVTMADPIVGTILFGSPSPLQGITKFIYETISKWKGKPNCNPPEQMARLMTIPKKTLDDVSRILGAASTPLKYLSSIFGSYDAWEPTGCDGVGIGRPVREAQLSTDGLWTVDVAISDLDVQGAKAPPGRYIRLEIFPGLEAHSSVADHTPTSSDVIRFRGPMVWDKDTDGDHPHGHMEIHPLTAIEFGVKDVKNLLGSGASGTNGTYNSRTGNSVDTVPGAGRAGRNSTSTPEYEVIKGDCLSKIAEHLYGKQQWTPIYCANKTKIDNPDLIYPGQTLMLPLTAEDFSRALCAIPNSHR